MKKLKKFIVVLFMFFFALFLISNFSFGIENTDQEEKKSYDLSVSLAGGNVSKNFSVFLDVLWAKKFNELFTQVTVVASLSKIVKEYGSSLGIGLEPGNFGFYVFVESLYRNGIWAHQVRPMFMWRTKHVSFEVFYAEPVKKAFTVVNGENIEVLKYWGGKLSFVPAGWLKFYVDAFFVGDDHNRLRLNAKIRALPWLLFSVGWSNSTSKFYSDLKNYMGWSAQIHINFGEQPDFRLDKSIPKDAHFPTAVYEGKIKVDHTPQYREIQVVYNSGDTSSTTGKGYVGIYWDLWESGKGDSKMENQGNGVLVKIFSRVRIQTSNAQPTHWVKIMDYRLPGVPYPSMNKIEIIGAVQSSIWYNDGFIYFRAKK